MPDLKIFISSPGDVPEERLRADLVVDKLAQDYSRFFALSTYRWEHEPMLASGHFQDAIEPPSATDILILVVWSRLGTPLPERTAVRAYRGIDGRVPVTGTEWEYEDALAAARKDRRPDIIAFRNRRPVPIDTSDPQVRAKSLAQIDALDAFWRRHFEADGTLLGASECYDSLDEFARLLEQKLRKLIVRRIAMLATDGAAPVWTKPPFRGLEAYEFEHAPIFFGRDAMVARAARHIAMAARHDNAFLLVTGPSGSGKSSLVKAALLPRLMKPQRIEGLAFLRRIIFKPSDAPGDLLRGFVDVLVEDRRRECIGLPELLSPGQTSADLARHLRAACDDPGFSFGAALGQITEAARKDGSVLAHESARAILVVDQLEELFTRDTIGLEERDLFVRLLAGLARSGLVWVIATMRSDVWHRAADLPALLVLAEGERRIDVAPPSPLELADMIRKPVEAAGLSFEQDRETGIGLDAELAKRAAAEPGVLPLLSFTLEAIFTQDIAQRPGCRLLSYASYGALGGLEGAIATRAEAIVGALPERAQAAVPRVLRALTTVSDGGDVFALARTAPLAAFAPNSDARCVIDAMTRGRLLVASGEGGQANVRVAHEALLVHWARASNQIAGDRRDLVTRKLVERQYERWRQEAGAAQTALLLRDPDLTAAVDLETRWGTDLEDTHGAFIRLSAVSAHAAARRRWVAAGCVMVLLAALATLSVAGLAVAERQRDQALIAQSRALARNADAATSRGDTTLAMLLALAALPRSLTIPDRPFVLDAEYPLSNAFANRRERSALRHDGNVNAIAFSADGTRFATASDDATAAIWDAATGHRIVPLAAHAGPVTSIEFSHDGRHAVTAHADGVARIWDAATGRLTASLDVHRGRLFSASFSRDDASVLVASRAATAIFDAASGRPKEPPLIVPDAGFLAAVLSPDDLRVATVSDDGTARLWSSAGVLLAPLPNTGSDVTSVGFSPDGRRLVSATEDGTARVWDVATTTLVSSLTGHAARINSAVFSPDGHRILTASDDHSARIWNVETGATIQALLGHDGIVYSAAFSADGSQVITASDDKTARVWDARNGFVAAVLGGHEGAVISALFSPDGRTLATRSHAAIVHLWNRDTSSTIAVLRNGTTPAIGVFSPDGTRIATGSEDGSLHIWDSRSGAPLAAWSGPAGSTRSIVFSPNGRFATTASTDGLARIWTVATGAVRLLRGHGKPVNTARFSADGRLIVTASEDMTARIWDANTLQCLHILNHAGIVTDAAFSPDGTRIVSTSSDQTGRLWDAHSGATIGALTGHMSFVKSAVFSPDGERIATAAGDGARLWNGRTGAPIAILGSGNSAVTGLAFAPDGRMLATASFDHAVRLWDARSGAFLQGLIGHELAVRSVVFSPDGRRLLSAGDDRTSRFWDVATGSSMAVFAGHEASVTSATFSPDGARVLTASVDATARLWTVPPLCQTLIDKAVGALPRDLTPDERKTYFLDSGASGQSERIHAYSAPLLALFVPRAGDVCQ